MTRVLKLLLAAVLSAGCATPSAQHSPTEPVQPFRNDVPRVLLAEDLFLRADMGEAIRIDVGRLPGNLQAIAYARLQTLFGSLGFRVVETRSMDRLDSVLLEQQGLAYDESRALRLGERTPAALLVTFDLQIRSLQPTASSLDRTNFYEASGVSLQVADVVTGEVLSSVSVGLVASTRQVSEQELLVHTLGEVEQALLADR